MNTATRAAEKTALTVYEVRFHPEQERHELQVATSAEQIRNSFNILEQSDG